MKMIIINQHRSVFIVLLDIYHCYRSATARFPRYTDSALSGQFRNFPLFFNRYYVRFECIYLNRNWWLNDSIVACENCRFLQRKFAKKMIISTSDFPIVRFLVRTNWIRMSTKIENNAFRLSPNLFHIRKLNWEIRRNRAVWINLTLNTFQMDI